MDIANAGTGLLERLIDALDQLPGRRPAPLPDHLETGRAGELAAFFHLRRLGYIVVARDWKSGRAPGDIDLIAWEGDVLCFVEVKTRTTHEVATAEAAVDEHKRRTLRRLAAHYRRHLPDDTLTRFDILAVYLTPRTRQPGRPTRQRATEIELFRGAFDWQ